MTTNSDQKFISYALKLAQRNLGGTSPNPVVGCVIVHEGKIIWYDDASKLYKSGNSLVDKFVKP